MRPPLLVLALVVLGCGADPEPAADACRGCDADGDGFRAVEDGGADCDDTNPAIHPNGREACNGHDDDCDGLVDDTDPDRDATDGIVVHPDRDGDGFGDGAAPGHLSCVAPAGFAPPGDCDDTDAGVFPGAPEACDGRDEDCDGLVDDADPDLDPASRTTWFADVDADGFGDPAAAVDRCRAPDAHVPNGLDCDDRAPWRNPAADEVCDGEPDNDCDGAPDPLEQDDDGDGFTECEGDCDDTDPTVHPDGSEVCNGVDDDCDGLVDTDDPSRDPYTCGWCPDPALYEDFLPSLYARSWNPCVLDPGVRNLCSEDPERPDTHDDGARLHRIRYRTDIPLRRELFLFFPPAHGGSNENIRRWAAYAGYRVISLGHDNSAVLKNFCAFSDDERCYTDARHEIVYGEDVSDVVEVGYADGVVRRLEVLLAHLHDDEPTLGWDADVDADGHVVWDDIVVSGWSRGAGTAGFLGRDHAVRAQVFFSGPMDRVGEEDPDVALWLQDPRATPGCTAWGIYHTLENNLLIHDAWDHFGLPRKITDVDTTDPPYDHAHRLNTTLYSPRRHWCDHHRAIGMDECMDASLIAPYLYMLCGAVDEPRDCDAR